MDGETAVLDVRVRGEEEATTGGTPPSGEVEEPTMVEEAHPKPASGKRQGGWKGLPLRQKVHRIKELEDAFEKMESYCLAWHIEAQRLTGKLEEAEEKHKEQIAQMALVWEKKYTEWKEGASTEDQPEAIQVRINEATFAAYEEIAQTQMARIERLEETIRVLREVNVRFGDQNRFLDRCEHHARNGDGASLINMFKVPDPDTPPIAASLPSE